MPTKSMDVLVALCKRRGLIFPSAQIYGGLQGIYDYGPLGVELKRNLKQTWWRDLVHTRDDVEGLDSSLLTHKEVLSQSGHIDTFTDPLVDCKDCKNRWRADLLLDDKCLGCGSKNLTAARDFNLMFKTQMGPVVNDESIAFLRPETAQGIFINFKNIVDSVSPKIPFGIAQLGKSFRNEITPRNFIFRVREFEQMELEFFVKPSEDEKWYQYWVDARFKWWQQQGLSSANLVCAEQNQDELAHYSKATTDILYRFPHGLEELEGIANRTDFDLGSHTKSQQLFKLNANVKENNASVAKLAVQDLTTKSWYIPYVIEPSAGVERGVLALLTEAYHEEEIVGGTRIVLKLQPHLAPVKAAIIPLAKNNTFIIEYAKKITNELKKQNWGRIIFENTGNIGKSYRKHDEIGTPACITVDFETIGETTDSNNKDTVTVRYRDTLQQERVKVDSLVQYLKDNFYQNL